MPNNTVQALHIWNLQTLADIYRERGDTKAAEETERQLWVVMQTLKGRWQS